MTKEECREQIQEDIRSYMDEDVCCGSGMPRYEILDELCQIVVDNFKKLDDEPEEIITEGDKKLKNYIANQQFFNDTYDTGGY